MEAAAFNVVDEIKTPDGASLQANRHYRAFEIAPDGSRVNIWTGVAMDIDYDQVWHPKSLYHENIQEAGYLPPVAGGGRDPQIVEKFMLPCWEAYTQWQVRALNYLIQEQRYEVIFSHIHHVDACGHFFWHLGKHRPKIGNDEDIYQSFMREVYRQTDVYLGSFLHLLDEGWTVFIVSDHGLMTVLEDEPQAWSNRKSAIV